MSLPADVAHLNGATRGACVAAPFAIVLLVAACAHDWEDLRFVSGGAGGSGNEGAYGAAGSGAVGGQGAFAGTGGVAASGGTGGTAGTGGAGGEVPCHWNDGGGDECDQGWYCYAPGCGEGFCRRLGSSEEDDLEPVCGCDGMTYWNPSVAAVHGMSFTQQATCLQTTACSPQQQPCPDPAHCRLHYPDEQGCHTTQPIGSCWVLPTECPNPPLETQHSDCISGGACRSQCFLIRSGEVFYPNPNCS